MKYLIVFFSITFSSLLVGQGIEFFKGTWEEALEKASSEDKLIFVDAYATWCGPCKRMSRDAFPNSEVGAYFNEHFVNMKIDMEKGMGLEFRKKYPVRAFPTLFFINGSGKVVVKQTGARKAKDLITMGKSAEGKANQSIAYLKLYEEGDRSYKTMYNLVKHLNKAGKPSLIYANEFIDGQKDMSTPDNLRFVLEATTEADSRIFELLMKHKEGIVAQEGEEKYGSTVFNAGMRTALKAAEYQDDNLFKDNRKKVKKSIPERSLEFDFYSSMNYYKAVNDPKSFLKIAKLFNKKNVGKNVFDKNAFVKIIHKQWSDESIVLDYAEKVAEEVALIGGTANYYVSYAMVLKDNGKKEKAIEALKEALSIGKKTNANTKNIQRLIDGIEQGAE